MPKQKLNNLVVDTTFGYCYEYFHGYINEPEMHLKPCETCIMQFYSIINVLNTSLGKKQRNSEIHPFPRKS